MFFRQNLKNDAYIWYKNDIEIEIKLNWIQLRIVFLFEYKIIVKNVQIKKFELKMKMFQFKQKNRKNIVDYFKRISKLIKKIIKNEINVEMITLRDMKNQSKKKQINFECNKNANYNYKTIEKFIKIVYNEIEKFDFFDSIYKNSIIIVLSHEIQFNENLLRQIFINTN